MFQQNHRLGPGQEILPFLTILGSYDKRVAFPYRKKGGVVDERVPYVNQLSQKYTQEQINSGPIDSWGNFTGETIIPKITELTDLTSPLSTTINPTYFMKTPCAKIYPEAPSFGKKQHRFQSQVAFKNELGPGDYDNDLGTINSDIQRLVSQKNKIASIKNRHMTKQFPTKFSERFYSKAEDTTNDAQISSRLKIAIPLSQRSHTGMLSNRTISAYSARNLSEMQAQDSDRKLLVGNMGVQKVEEIYKPLRNHHTSSQSVTSSLGL